MQIHILALDGSVTGQQGLLKRHRPNILRVRDWGPSIRLGCRFGRFRQFEQELADRFPAAADGDAPLVFCGSGDFHHVSLALIRRIHQPFNLLVVDNHPDWMRGVPFLHCGTWVYHAARHPMVQRIFHVGGDVDFDNYYRCLAPWPLLRSGKITVLPGARRFQGGSWPKVRHEPVRPDSATHTTGKRLEALLQPFREDLARWPLYISLDKDVMVARDAVVNWDSGHLELPEVQTLLQSFLAASRGKLVGMDIVGDWSPVCVRGWLRQFLHLTEHPALEIDPVQATERNEQVNLAILDCLPAFEQTGIYGACA